NFLRAGARGCPLGSFADLHAAEQRSVRLVQVDLERAATGRSRAQLDFFLTAATEVNFIESYPGARAAERGFPAGKRIRVVQEGNRDAFRAHRAVAVDLDLAPRVHESDTAQRRYDFLDRAVGVE